MNIDWKGKYVREVIIGIIFFIILFVAIKLLVNSLDADISNSMIVFFSAIVAGLGSAWIFRNVMY